MFWLRNMKKIIFQYALLSEGLKYVSCILLFDVSKVSDGVLHEGILYKFRHYGAAWKL